MTHEELARRLPLWNALSDLFLDTEVRWFIPRVALACASSGYDDEALERIFWAEAFPEFIDNLTQVAGEWAMLDLNQDSLVRRANHGSIPWLRRRADGGLVQDSWLATREVTRWLRAEDATKRAVHTEALTLLGYRYFEDPGRPSLTASRERFLTLGLPVLRAEWTRYETVLRKLLHDDADHEPQAAEVRALLVEEETR